MATLRMQAVLLSFSLIFIRLAVGSSCDVPDKSSRFDCFPGTTASKEACESRGCCWRPSVVSAAVDVPYCFYPTNYDGYNITHLEETDYGYDVKLERSSNSGWPNDIKQLVVKVWIETEDRVKIKVFDPSVKRYEVRIETPSPPTRKPAKSDFKIDFTVVPFGITVRRASTNALLFDSTVAPLIFADQFLQISTRLSSPYLYGLGEHMNPLLYNVSSWKRIAIWARDQAPVQNTNLYGSHPFYLNLESDGKAHGVFLLNSNAMDVDLQPLPALTFRPIGGVLDIYIFSGPSPDHVVHQYIKVIGAPQFPPYWALGFHLCRYNYNSVARLKFIIERNRKIGIPYDVQWNDIDYMSLHLDWTYDNKSYAGLPAVVEDLHKHGQRYVVIVDPGISNSRPGEYPPYDEGIVKNVFINDDTGKPLIGKVWPGTTVFPDFTNPNTTLWWQDMAERFHDLVPYDGLWTDMNEPSNFVEGSLTGCPNNSLNYPPYVPVIAGNGKLASNTICPSARHYISTHYNLHNMYGLSEVIATNQALHAIRKKRSIVISRSSYPSLGRYGGHWTGDVFSTWEDLRFSIPAILEFQWYGIPLVGADVCGFLHNTTEEMCIRWMQLGAFYPFMRNHNDDISVDQDPAAWSKHAQDIMKDALHLRYSLLPFMYTQFLYSHLYGTPLIRPLFFLYPTDQTTYNIDTQFIWGTDLLISPALEQGQAKVNAYFPDDLWYDIYDGRLTSDKAQYITLPSPLEKINVHMRGGSIVPLQQPAVTTTLARKTPFALVVALNRTKQAAGSLYWDDGESTDVSKTGAYNYLSFQVDQGHLKSTLVHKGYKDPNGMKLEDVMCVGLQNRPKAVVVNGQSVSFKYNDDTKALVVTNLAVNLMEPISITWN